MTNSIDAFTNSAKAISNILAGSTSPFSNYDMNINQMNTDQLILFYFILFILIYFTMFIGSLLFNVTIVKMFPSIKKITTIDFFGLYIVLHMLFC
jgi:hypothetical protein